MGVKNMQGVPAHIEFLHDAKHERRNMLWCKNLIKPEKICDLPNSPYFGIGCGGAPHCDFYEKREKELL